MTLTNIVAYVNANLAGELLTYEQLKVHLDSVIDDINGALNSAFPAFSEFNSTDHTSYPNYNFFPDKYLRAVVCLGAAFKFYICDEEGAESAKVYAKTYPAELFKMQRDYTDLVPTIYQTTGQGYLTAPVDSTGVMNSGLWPEDEDADITGLFPSIPTYS